MKVWLLENEQARWFEFEEPHDMPNDVAVTMLTEVQLIVEECADWINDNVGMIDEEARQDLLKHFGVNDG